MIAYNEARDIAVRLLGVADPHRMKILHALLEGARCVGEIAKLLGIPMVNTSHHLKVMRQSGLLTHHKEGRKVVYALNPEVLSLNQDQEFAAQIELGSWAMSVRRNGADQM